MRLIYNNLADIATITASSTVAGTTSNLQNNRKSSVHRTGTSVTYTLTWASAQLIKAVALPATNLVAGSTIEVKLYSGTVGNYTLITGGSKSIAAATDRNIVLPGNVTTPNYTHFSVGGATKTSLWFPSITTPSTKVEIILSNANAIDCSRIVCGNYWEPTRQVSKGITIGIQDSSEVSSTRNGDTYINTTYTRESMNFELQYFNDADRKQLLNIFRTWGSNSFVYVSIFPDETNSELMQTYSIYGRNNDLNMQYDIAGFYTTSLSLESW